MAGSAQTRAPEAAVKETHRISIDYNPVSGRKKLNTYEIIRELGRGEHGRVKLGFDVDKQRYVAIKLLNRKEKPRLGRPQGCSTEEKIHREIAILKKCHHSNIVRLIEVLDDESSRKIYLVLEYCAKGEIKWQTPDGNATLSREQARGAARNVALGLEYLHANGIIHRDIKPANLLVSGNDVVKISDFGVSYAVSREESARSELELAKTVGTPAFFSPELCIPTEINHVGERKTPPISSKVDVWAFGVTLYCLLYGYLPFEADNEYELFRVIANEEICLPDPKGDKDLTLANDLLSKLLIRDPSSRPSISEIKHHPWLVANLASSTRREYTTSVAKAILVTNEDVSEAVKGVNIKTRLKQSLSRIKEQVRSRRPSHTTVRDPPSKAKNSSEEPTNFPAKPPSKTPTKESSNSPTAPTRMRSEPLLAQQSRPIVLKEGQSDPMLAVPSCRDSLSDGDSLTSTASNGHSTELSQSVSGSGIGLKPMKLSDDNSLKLASHTVSIENLSLCDSNSSRLPEINIPRLDNESVWGLSPSSSSEDDDSGELTLVVGRNRSRSIERGRNVSEITSVSPKP